MLYDGIDVPILGLLALGGIDAHIPFNLSLIHILLATFYHRKIVVNSSLHSTLEAKAFNRAPPPA